MDWDECQRLMMAFFEDKPRRRMSQQFQGRVTQCEQRGQALSALLQPPDMQELTEAMRRTPRTSRRRFDRIPNSDERGPVVRIVQAIWAQAIALGASDIYIEPQDRYRHDAQFAVILRIDGVRQTMTQLSMELHAPVVQRIKVLADLTPTHRNMPRERTIRVRHGRDWLKMRARILPGRAGESVAIRIGRKVADNEIPPLDAAGLRGKGLKRSGKCSARTVASRSCPRTWGTRPAVSLAGARAFAGGGFRGYDRRGGPGFTPGRRSRSGRGPGPAEPARGRRAASGQRRGRHRAGPAGGGVGERGAVVGGAFQPVPV